MNHETPSHNESSRFRDIRFPIFDPEAKFDRLETAKFSLGVLGGSTEAWKLVGSDLTEIHNKVIDPIIKTKRNLPIYRYLLQKTVLNPNCLLITLQAKESKKIVGYTMAFPSPVPHNTFQLSSRYNLHKECIDSDLSLEQYQDLQMGTIEVGETAILPEYQDQGGWSLMMQELDRRMKKLKDEGKYQDMLRVVRDWDGYSERVKNRYAQQLIYQHNCNKDFGPQKFYRFRL